MKIVILNFEDPWFVLMTTSLIKGFRNKFPNCNINFFVSQESFSLLEYNKKIVAEIGYTTDTENSFDLAINFSPSLISANMLKNINSKVKKGFLESSQGLVFSDKATEEYYNTVYNKKISDRNLLQIIYKMCNLTWRGEGYDLSYYPKNRNKDFKTGIAIKETNLRQYVKNNLKLKLSEMCIIPMRENILKKIDEINRCSNIVTDDFFVVHAGIALRKNVEFLDVDGLSPKFEFFGRGNCYRIVNNEWRNEI